MDKIDPNLIIGLLVPLAAWLYNKATGRKQASIKDVALGIVDNAIHLAVITADSNPTVIVAFVEQEAWKALDSAKVSRGAATGLMVHAAVQAAVAAAIQEAKDHDRVEKAQIAANRALFDTMKPKLAELDKLADAALAESQKPFGGGAPNVTIIKPGEAMPAETP